jgi:predicted ATP-grasp superfamily ATP-dependent carboligase
LTPLANTPPIGSRILIVAQSARRLAQSARAAGFIPVVIDAFGDRDTRAASQSTRCVVFTASGFCAHDLMQSLREVAERYGALPAVYGGGFEFAPSQLDMLGRFASIHGNQPNILTRVTTPRDFFALLSSVGIAHPETVLSGEVGDSRILWLIKRGRSCGGGGIEYYAGEVPQSMDAYLQKMMFGDSLSVVFLADGFDVELIGWTRHFGAATAAPWRFAGAASTREIPSSVARSAGFAIEKLVGALGLKGLCGADFIVDTSKRPLLVDLNVRPTAGFELYDGNGSLFRRHLQTASGELAASLRPERDFERAFLTVYAPRSYRELPMDWPEWVTDIPCAPVESGHPLCTVNAEAPDTAAAIVLAQARAAELRQYLTNV